MKIYTKTGDKGTTSLVGGERVSKDSEQIEAYGTSDELNSFIGLLRSQNTDNYIDSTLHRIQSQLFSLGSQLAMPQEGTKEWAMAGVEQREIEWIEETIDKLTKELPKLDKFLLPTGSQAVALCHVCRTVARRLERRIVRLHNAKYQNEQIYVNRLSDLFFTLARFIAEKNQEPLFLWDV